MFDTGPKSLRERKKKAKTGAIDKLREEIKKITRVMLIKKLT